MEKLFAPRYEAHARCELFCGVYDRAQAMIEAHSCLKSTQKYQDSDDEVLRARAIAIKEERAKSVKQHQRLHHSQTGSGEVAAIVAKMTAEPTQRRRLESAQ